MAVSVLAGHAVPPPRWPWLPLAVVPIAWQPVRRRTWKPKWPRVRDWWVFAVRPFESLVFLFWLYLETWSDRRTVRRRHLDRDAVLTADNLQTLLSRLRGTSGVIRLASLVRRHELQPEPDAITFLEDLAARADAHDRQEQSRRPFSGYRRADWLAKGWLPERALDQIALISEARLRIASRSTVVTVNSGSTLALAQVP